MNKSAYNSSGAGKDRGPENFLRCNMCHVAPAPYGEQPVGSILISEIIYLRTGDEPSTPIGRVTRCSNPECSMVPVVKLWRVAETLDIKKNDVYRLIKACRGVASFKLHEVYSGELDQEVTPASLADKFRPQFGTPAEEQKAAPTLFEQGQPEEVPAL